MVKINFTVDFFVVKEEKGMKLEITKEELKLDGNIKKKLDIICEFCHIKPRD
jgi:hypothetical protein